MMKSKFRLPGSSMLVYYYIKLTGLAPFIIRNNRFHSPTLPGKLYPLFVAAIFLFYYVLTMVLLSKSFYARDISLFYKMWGAILDFTGLLIIPSTVVMSLMMHKKIICMLNNLATISHELENLGIEQDHGKFFGNMLVKIVTVNAALVTFWITLYLVEPVTNIVFAFRDYINTWYTTNTFLLFFQLLIGIRQCFTLVNKALYDLATPAGHRPRLNLSGILIVVVGDNGRDDGPERVDLCTDYQRLRIIETSHMELSDLVLRTTHLFATPILLNGFDFSIRLVAYFYWMYQKSSESTYTLVIWIVACAIRIVFATVQLLFIAHASVTTCEEGNATKAVLFKVWNKYTPAELEDEELNRMFSRFSQQLQHTTIAVSNFGIADLDYSFIYAIFGTVITYVIILIQFDLLKTSS